VGVDGRLQRRAADLHAVDGADAVGDRVVVDVVLGAADAVGAGVEGVEAVGAGVHAGGDGDQPGAAVDDDVADTPELDGVGRGADAAGEVVRAQAGDAGEDE